MKWEQLKVCIMLKFHRNYKIEFIVERFIDGKWEVEKVLTVQNPIYCNFTVDASLSGQANLTTIQFINLNSETRSLLWLDLWENGKKRISFSFYAGYGYPNSEKRDFTQVLISKGYFMVCTSYKMGGSTDWITEIQAIPSDAFEKSFINATFSGGTSLEDVLNYMVKQASDLKLGYITPEIQPLPRNKTFIGQTIDLLGREYGGYDIFIDKGMLNILGENDVLPGDLVVITDASGLLGTPKRAMQYLEIEMLFEPQLKIGQAVSLMSNLMPELNQAYKIMGIKHSGTISERECGKLTTKLTLSCVPDVQKINVLEKAKPTEYKKQADTKWEKPVKGYITENYGWRYHPILKQNKFHEGIDIGADYNTPVYAPANGKVTFVGWEGGYGNAVWIDNGEANGINITSRYAHLNRANVNKGDTVYKGKSIIGYVGSSGKYSNGTPSSTGPHLHFEIRENGKSQNPAKYIGNY